MKSPFLKLKIKSLAYEARIIREAERRKLGFARHVEQMQAAGINDAPVAAGSDARRHYVKMHLHRTVDVRREARATHLAQGFLSGKKLLEIEPHLSSERAQAPNWDAVQRMALRYYEGPLEQKEVQEHLRNWIADANLVHYLTPSWVDAFHAR